MILVEFWERHDNRALKYMECSAAKEPEVLGACRVGFETLRMSLMLCTELHRCEVSAKNGNSVSMK